MEQYEKLKEHIPDGVRRKFFSILIDDVIDLFEGPHGEYVLGAVLSKKAKPRDLLKSLPNGQSTEGEETS